MELSLNLTSHSQYLTPTLAMPGILFSVIPTIVNTVK